MFRFFLSTVFTLALSGLVQAQTLSESIAQLDPPEATVSGSSVDRFVLLAEQLPERHRDTVFIAFQILTPGTRLMILEMFDAFQTDDDRQDMRLISTTTGLFKRVEDLVMYIENGTFPDSGQLPNAVEHFERLAQAFPSIGEMLGGEFAYEIRIVQEEAFALYDAHIASLDTELDEARAELDEARAELDEARAEGEQLAEAERRLEALHRALSAMSQ